MAVWFVELTDSPHEPDRVVPSCLGPEEEIPPGLMDGYFIGSGFRVWVRATTQAGAMTLAYEARREHVGAH